jgi:hypothetical protein
MPSQVALREGGAGDARGRGHVVEVHLPKDGRGRMFALRQLRSLAAHGGYTVNKRRGQAPPVTGQT